MGESLVKQKFVRDFRVDSNPIPNQSVSSAERWHRICSKIGASINFLV